MQFRNAKENNKFSYRQNTNIQDDQIFRHPSNQSLFRNFPISEIGSSPSPEDCWKFLQNNTREDDLMELMCVFCKSNGERPLIYNSHMLKIGDYIVCPVLRNCICALCFQRGHTMGHCKVNPSHGSVVKRLFSQKY